MTFEEYLTSKKIDSLAFLNAEPEKYKEYKEIFEQMHPNSFSMQKLNMINPIRRRYPFLALEPGREIKPEVKKETIFKAVFKKKDTDLT